MASEETIPSGVDDKQIKKAANALLQFLEKKKTQTSSLIDVPEQIVVQFAVHKVIADNKKTTKIRLPWSLATSTSDICLLVRDVVPGRDYSKSVRHFKERLDRKGIKNISEILPLKALKHEYIEFEAKRKLLSSYDVFLADAKIMNALPKLLGKSFYKRKRFPIQINLGAKNLQGEVKRALSTSLCIFNGRGSSTQITVGHADMTSQQIEENVMTAFTKIFDTVPGGSQNLKHAHLKSEKSPALPFYISSVKSDDVKLPRKKTTVKTGHTDEFLLDNSEVHVTDAGQIIVRKNKPSSDKNKSVASESRKKTTLKSQRHKHTLGFKKNNGKRKIITTNTCDEPLIKQNKLNVKEKRTSQRNTLPKRKVVKRK